MALNSTQLRASLKWEAACERLRNAVQPPDGMGVASDAQRNAALELAQQALNGVRQAFATSAAPDAPATDNARPAQRDLVAIGTAEGGMQALTRLLHALPTGFPATVLVALSHGEDSALLSEITRTGVAIPVSYGRDGETVQPGHVYLAPPQSQLFVQASGALGVQRGAGSDGAPRIIDRLLRSVAEVHGSRAVGVILSGCNGDGVDGMNAIEEADGIGIVQDPEEALEAALPSHVINEDRPHYIATLDGIAVLLDTLIDRR